MSNILVSDLFTQIFFIVYAIYLRVLKFLLICMHCHHYYLFALISSHYVRSGHCILLLRITLLANMLTTLNKNNTVKRTELFTYKIRWYRQKYLSKGTYFILHRFRKLGRKVHTVYIFASHNIVEQIISLVLLFFG